MTSRALLILALVASLLIPGAVAFAGEDDPPDSAGNAGGTTDGGGGNGAGEGKDGGKGKEGEEGKGQPQCGGNMMLPLLLIGGLMMMIMMSGRGRKKQQAKLNAMLAGLKKGDKVRTIGGILGSVVEVREDEVVIRIDDNANTRMRVVRRAIAGAVVDGKKDGEDAR